MNKKILTILICAIGGLITVITGIFSFFCEGWSQSFFVALSVNVLTTVLGYLFITVAVEKIDAKKEERLLIVEEKKAIGRYLPLLKTKISNYIQQFNELTQNMKDTLKGGLSKTFNDIVVNKMSDMFLSSVLPRNKILSSVIESYFNEYLSVSSFVDRTLFSVNFSKYIGLKQALENIYLKTNDSNGIKSLISFDKYHHETNPEIASCLVKMMNEYDGDFENDYSSGKYSGNLFLNVILLCHHLKINKEAFQQLIKEIELFEKEN